MRVKSIKENNMENLEIVKFNNGDFELDVKVSPNEDTVWLSKEQMGLLFDRDRSVISRHIKHIFMEKELDEKSNVHFLHIAVSDKPVPFYSLDVIISVGYRVHSKKGVIFRKWANRILKDYLIKGYVVNPKKIEITVDDWNALNTQVKYLENKIEKIEENISKREISDQLFFEGEFYNAANYLSGILKSAKQSVAIIDPYFDAIAMEYLKYIKNGIRIEIFTSIEKLINDFEVQKFRKQNSNFKVFITHSFHDRFIIIDQTKCYQIGTSLNSLGNKTFGVTQIKDAEYIDILQNRVNQSKIA